MKGNAVKSLALAAVVVAVMLGVLLFTATVSAQGPDTKGGQKWTSG
jgi:hypothetical protein